MKFWATIKFPHKLNWYLNIPKMGDGMQDRNHSLSSHSISNHFKQICCYHLIQYDWCCEFFRLKSYQYLQANYFFTKCSFLTRSSAMKLWPNSHLNGRSRVWVYKNLLNLFVNIFHFWILNLTNFHTYCLFFFMEIIHLLKLINLSPIFWTSFSLIGS